MHDCRCMVGRIACVVNDLCGTWEVVLILGLLQDEPTKAYVANRLRRHASIATTLSGPNVSDNV